MIAREVKQRLLDRIPDAPMGKNHGAQRGEFSGKVQRMLSSLDHERVAFLASFDPAELAMIGDFMCKIKKQPAPPISSLASDCWIWTGPRRNKFGYGATCFFGRVLLCAHRASYQMFRGPIPEMMVLDHLCRVPACVNPWHLEPVTSTENNLRGTSPVAQNKRKEKCPYGHAYDRIRSDGHRECTKCSRRRVREWRERERKKANA